MSERVSAIPDHLLRYAGAARELADELRRAQDDLALAYGTARARCGHHLPLDAVAEDAIGRAAELIEELGRLGRATGEAFARAGRAGPDGVVRADADRIRFGGVPWSARASLVGGAAGEWAAAIYGARCAGSPDAFYVGSEGFIVGPDGRRYPLVAPTVVRGGRWFNGGAVVDDLGGLDPGWRLVDVEAGVERHRGAPSVLGRLLVGIGSTVAGAPVASTSAQVRAVTLHRWAPPTLALVGDPRPNLEAVPSTPSDERGSGRPVAAGGFELLPAAAEVAMGALRADDGSEHAYQVTFEQNEDGRLRATYLRVDVAPPAEDSDPWVLSPSYVVGPTADDVVTVRYDLPTASEDPHVVVAVPADDELRPAR